VVPAAPRGTEKNHEYISQDSQSPGRDLNKETPEYGAGLLNIQPQRSIFRFIQHFFRWEKGDIKALTQNNSNYLTNITYNILSCTS
jgi:hypothetical protein